MKAAEIRSRFLKYFEKNGHTIVESSSLVPQNDPTLLFTNAGMVQFKDVFLGKDPRPYKRATTSQKCVRAGGKHNDLENVGFTARHHTFFEMLGNFSFGDYFKKDAIRFAWEFVTQELKLPKDRLYVTVFENDDEAADIWHQQEGVPKDRIYRFGEKDNFWSMGDTGPCGPCSEIFIDRGAQYSCGKTTCAMGCDCDRYMEFWNLVFMQFNRDSSGTLTPLPRPSVDTGAGLERIASILQEVETNYDTDAFLHIISKTAELAGQPYDRKAETAVSFRVVADHSRATAFLIGDGVMPSNEGRGYVLRRIIRRAIRHGKKLGFTGPFLHKATGFVIEQMQDAYPDMVEKRAFIEKAVFAEEEQFFRTLERGLTLLDEETGKLAGAKTLPGEVAFKLYDTFGFPLDLTRVICAEKGIAVDEPGFEKAMDRQREMARKNWKGSGDEAINSIYLKLATDLKAAGKLPKFTGYEKGQDQGECLKILATGAADKNEMTEVQSFATPAFAAATNSPETSPIIEVVFATTPFYGESGGQLGDRGRVFGINGMNKDEFLGEVIDVQRPVPELIVAHVRPVKGTLKVGTHYTQQTDAEIRALTARNHTATHILHWALREVLGKHVKQSGSLVGPELLRFDFSHFQAMTEQELTRVENLVNERVWGGEAVLKKEMNKEEAIASGAIAFFGEKYGDTVRVIKVGGFSTELCGGTHVDHSSDIHLFKIANESGIAAGVRRIIAYTSKGAFEYLRKRDLEVKIIRDRLKASSSDEILGKLDKMTLTERELRKEIEQFQAKSASGEVDEMLAKAEVIQGTRLVTYLCAPDTQGVKRLRDLCERVKQKAPDAVMVLGMKDPASDKASLIVAVGPQAPKTLNSNDILKELAPLIEGRGGGKADMAQAGGTKPTGLPDSLKLAAKVVAAKLGN
ncbi:MAG: alanine--tRNA ligase [Bdellovibrionales bacterium GWB1_52_6]|nr:MAG: alanine--tRNA ligase [Bdellovibrionales bacterium GWB1_52_6]OFZ05098.1 MAG: alanine--tRNA ligase [Bdellovibrionales bacterium GWA1_52_35]HCM41328.1 alanine--tRNA ligase [Bdellovibrionales bacterium]